MCDKIMHLVFLYVDDFRCLKNAAFNFDLNYKFEVQDHKICLVSELQRKISLKSFFSLSERRDGGCVSSINAIIGPNGSGKTTLAFVLQQLAKGMPVTGDCIAIFKNDEWDGSKQEFYCCSSVAQGRREYEREEKLVARSEIGPFRLWRTMIYYSPIYAAVHPIVGDDLHVFDVSTTAQMKKMPNAIVREGNGRRSVSTPAVYDSVESRSILEVLNEPKMQDFFSTRPVGLRVAPSKYALAVCQEEAASVLVADKDISALLNAPEFDEYEEDRLAVFGRIIPWAARTGRLALAFVLYAMGVVRTSFDKGEHLYGRSFASYAKDLYVFCKAKLMDMRNDGAVLSRVTEFLSSELEKFSEHNDWYRGISLTGLISGAKEVFNTLSGLPFSSYSDYKMGPLYHDFLLTSSEGKLATDRILSLLANHADSAIGMDYLEFTLDPPLSSGEAAFLSMFGRVLNALRELRCTQAGIFPVLIFLDEAEAALHPNLQRNLVSNFIRFCERCTEDMDVQIIFASHSPMLLSDIPKGNVCFLREKEANVDSHQASIDKLPNTFGANILDLFRLGFFMQQGAVGGFAAHKINLIIHKFRNGDLLDEDEQSVIEQVGDPLVRSYLRSLSHQVACWRSGQ